MNPENLTLGLAFVAGFISFISPVKSDWQSRITALIKIDTIEKIVAALRGGKHGTRHRCANFAPQKAAANRRSATVVT